MSEPDDYMDAELAAIAESNSIIDYGKVAELLTEMRHREEAARLLREIKAAQGLSFEFKTADELLTEQSVKWAVPRWFPCRGTGIMFGEEYTGKSFLELALAGSLSLGVPWLGQESCTTGTVILCWGEGRSGLGQRMRAMVQGHLGGEKPSILALEEPFPLTPRTALEFVKAVESQQAGNIVLIAFDSKLDYLLGDENSNTDAQQLREAMEIVSTKLDCFVLCIDHIGNSIEAKNRPRGASRFRQSVDVQVKVEPNIIECKKNKEGSKPPRLGFEIREVPGTESATVYPLGLDSAVGKQRASLQARLVAALEDLEPECSRDEVISAISHGMACNMQDASAHLNDMVRTGLLSLDPPRK